MTNGTQFTLPLTSAYTARERDLLTAFAAADRPPFMVVHWADNYKGFYKKNFKKLFTKDKVSSIIKTVSEMSRG